jgi:hypothetical protein
VYNVVKSAFGQNSSAAQALGNAVGAPRNSQQVQLLARHIKETGMREAYFAKQLEQQLAYYREEYGWDSHETFG